MRKNNEIKVGQLITIKNENYGAVAGKREDGGVDYIGGKPACVWDFPQEVSGKVIFVSKYFFTVQNVESGRKYTVNLGGI